MNHNEVLELAAAYARAEARRAAYKVALNATSAAMKGKSPEERRAIADRFHADWRK